MNINVNIEVHACNPFRVNAFRQTRKHTNICIHVHTHVRTITNDQIIPIRYIRRI